MSLKGIQMIKINVITVFLIGGVVILMGQVTQAEQKIIVPEKAAVYLTRGEIGKVDYSPDGQLLAVARSVGVFLYDAVDLTEVGVLIAISPDNKFLVSSMRLGQHGNYEHGILLWDVESQEQIGFLKGHKLWTNFLVFLQPRW